jgi:hypothetical protein
MGRACRPHGAKRNVYRVLVGKSEGKRPLGKIDVGGRIILKWVLREVRWGDMDWIFLVQDRDQ